jgi:hypothetical protein
MIHDEHNVERAALHRRLGLSSPAITLLAAIAAIRVPLHDLASSRTAALSPGCWSSCR